MIINNIDVELTPEQVAEAIWNLDDSEQAQMFAHLYDTAGEYHLMMQFLNTRDRCEQMAQKGDRRALDAFQCMFSSGYKYMGG